MTVARAAAWTLAACMACVALGPSASLGSGSSGGAAEEPVVPPDPMLSRAVDLLVGQLDENGCYGDPSTLADTAWIAQAVAAGTAGTGEHASLLAQGLITCEPSPAASTTDLANHILGIVAVGGDPYAFNGKDWVALLKARFGGVQFVEPKNPRLLNDDAFAILALRAAGVSASAREIHGAASYLVDQQNDDGGWGFADNTASTVEMTGAVLEALAAARVLDNGRDLVDRAVSFIADHPRGPPGCLGTSRETSRPDSTAWALVGLLAAHRDPRTLADGQGQGPWTCLRGHEHGSGGFWNEPDEPANIYTTTQVVMALAAVPHGQARPSLARPTATLSTSEAPTVGEPVALVASGVPFAGWQAPDGTIVQGSPAEWWPTHAGDVQFDVLLVDAGGVASTASFTTTVAPAGPSNEDGGSGTGGPSAAPELPELTLAVPRIVERNVSTDLELAAVPGDNPVVAFRVDWGDGAVSPWGPEQVRAHDFATLGEQVITAWARDAHGAVSKPAQVTVHVVDARPIITVEGPVDAYRHEPVRLEALAVDPDGPAPIVTWAGANEPATGPVVEIAFAEPGAHTITATAEDASGQTVSASWTVEVVNRPPVLESVGPLAARANGTHVIEAQATDPDGDELVFGWRLGHERAWGRQFHLDTGPPGNVSFQLNVSDPHGGWVLSRVTVIVTEPARHAGAGSIVVTDRSTPSGNVTTSGANAQDTGPVIGTPAVELPDQVLGEPGVATLLEGRARVPNATASAVEVTIGGPVPVRGVDPFVALLPALPDGVYSVAARAAGPDGVWGPWTNTTLVIEPVAAPVPSDEPLARLDTASPDVTDGPRSTPGLASVLALAILALSAGLGRRRA